MKVEGQEACLNFGADSRQSLTFFTPDYKVSPEMAVLKIQQGCIPEWLMCH